MTLISSDETQLSLNQNQNSPTVASEVTSETPLEQLNLNWTEKELPEKERTKHVHRLHPYLGKFVPQLAEIFLRKYFQPGQTVLDPFCGSGTTLIQANELGINSIGCDVSVFNTLLCLAKTTHYNLHQVHQEVMDILEKTRKLILTHPINFCSNEPKQLSLLDLQLENYYSQELNDFSKLTLELTENEYLKQWFAPQALFELLAYRNLINTENYEYSNLLKIILSRSARSARLTTHFDLDFPKQPQREPYWCYKHSRTCQPTTEAFKFIKRYSLDSLKRLEEFYFKQTDATVNIIHTDSGQTEISTIDGVITSPPYVGLIDYHQQHAYAYHLLGLVDHRHLEIGAAAKGSSRKAQQKYQADIAQVFQKVVESLRPGGTMIVIAGDKFNLYPEIAEMIGVETEKIVQRQVNRRTGRRSGEFYESVFIWKKS